MVDVRPFCGLRFRSGAAADQAQVLSPPYDVISADERRELLARSPYNIVRIELPDPESSERYAEAGRLFDAWRAAGVLERDATPSFYLYDVRFRAGGEDYTRRALVAAVRLAPWDAGQVLPHELTMSAPKEDRLRLMQATAANISPIWTLFRGSPPALRQAWTWADAQAPVLDCTLDDGTSHRLWQLDAPELLAALVSEFAQVRLVIADGHHRYETALRYRDELEEQSAAPLPAEHPANFVMMHLVAEDDPGVVILPTHRLLRGLGDLDQAELEAELGPDWHGEYYPIWEGAPPDQLKALLEQLASSGQASRAVGLYGPDPSIFSILLLRNKQLLEERAVDRSEAWRGLDVALLHVGLVEPLLARAGDGEATVAFERDPYAAMQAVRRGDYQVACFLNATRPDQVIAVAESGDRMPEKSTYFYPKLPTGLVVRDLV